MLMHDLFGENLFDDWFGFPDFRELEKEMVCAGPFLLETIRRICGQTRGYP